MRRALCLLVFAGCARSQTGTHRVNYPQGNPHFEYITVDGVPNGRGRVWYPNGELQSEGPYVNGAKHGEFTFYTDDGRLDHRAVYVNNEQVWHSRDPQAMAPRELLDRIEAPPVPEGNGLQLLRFSAQPPQPYFATLDRTTALDRIGLQLGFGDAGSVRTELFANHRFGRYGVYGQLSQTQARGDIDVNVDPTMAQVTLAGRRTVEAGATYPVALDGIGMLSPRAGLLVPIGNDSTAGFVASSFGAFQRPTDAATSVPSTLALRTGASLVRRGRYFVVQADAGLDWLFGGEQHAVDALVRANAGAGLGVRSVLFSVELSNTMRVSDPAERIHAVGLAGTYWLQRMWVTALVSETFDGHSAISGALGYEL